MPWFTKHSADAVRFVAFAFAGVVGSRLERLLKSFNSPISYAVLLFHLGIFLALLLNYLEMQSADFGAGRCIFRSNGLRLLPHIVVQ